MRIRASQRSLASPKKVRSRRSAAVSQPKSMRRFSKPIAQVIGRSATLEGTWQERPFVAFLAENALAPNCGLYQQTRQSVVPARIDQFPDPSFAVGFARQLSSERPDTVPEGAFEPENADGRKATQGCTSQLATSMNDEVAALIPGHNSGLEEVGDRME